MTGATLPCIFCQKTEDVRGRKLYRNCELLNGDACTVCQDYVVLEDKISATKQILGDLLSQQLKLRAQVNENHDILSRIPVEIVCSVFRSCLPSDDLNVFDEDYRHIHDDDHYHRDSGKKDSRLLLGPLFLGRICKAWRTLAWEMSPLWTVIRLSINRTKSPSYADLARKWLERAGELPLSIRITEYYNRSLPPDTLEIIALINSKSKQWKNMDILGTSTMISQFKGGSAGAPDLRALRIDTEHWSHIQGGFESFSLTGAKPQPSHINLANCDLSRIHIEWTHLKNVCLSYSHVDVGMELLRLAPRVERYVFYAIENDSQQFSKPEEPIIYGALESLELGDDVEEGTGIDCQSKEIMTFLKGFIFPNLTHLKANSGWANKLSWAPVIAHFANYAPPLKSLAIEYCGPHPFTECIHPLLQIVPSLQDLDILGPPWQEEQMQEYIKFFELLTDTCTSIDTQAKFLPSLQSLSFSIRRTSEEDTQILWSYICGIFGPIADIHDTRRRPLRTVQVQMDNLWPCFRIKSKNIALELSNLHKEGIILDIKDFYGKNVFPELLGEHNLCEPPNSTANSTIRVSQT